jgi:hypothetical protein
LVAFFVVFFALGCFIPQAMLFSPPPFFYIDLFIPFNLIFVKEFLRELPKALSALLIARLPTAGRDFKERLNRSSWFSMHFLSVKSFS